MYRRYKKGDILYLQEYKDGNYTERQVTRRVSYVYYGTGEFGLAEGYAVLGLTPIEN